MSSRFSSYARALVLTGLLLTLIPIGAAAATRFAGQSGDAAAPISTPGNLLLRPNDLQIGYKGFTKCGALEEIDRTPPQLSAFIRNFKPKGCIEGFVRVFAVRKGQEPDPSVVGSAVLDARSPAEADVAIAVLPELLGRITDNHPPEEVAPTTKIGDMTRLFHLDTEFDTPASALIWRSGSVLAGVLVGGRSTGSGGGGLAVSDSIAAVYAARQQAHIEARTPYVPPAKIGRDATLDDPRLGVDVHWFGVDFHPGHGLPSSSLLEVATGGNSFSPGVFLEYQDNLFLEIWKRSAWRNQRHSYFNRSVRDSRCTTTKTIALPEGRAMLYAGYREHFGPCPKRPPNAFLADAFFGKTVVTVSPGDCVYCGHPRGTPFNSERAVITALHHLRPRQPRQPR